MRWVFGFFGFFGEEICHATWKQAASRDEIGTRLLDEDDEKRTLYLVVSPRSTVHTLVQNYGVVWSVLEEFPGYFFRLFSSRLSSLSDLIVSCSVEYSRDTRNAPLLIMLSLCHYSQLQHKITGICLSNNLDVFM